MAKLDALSNANPHLSGFGTDNAQALAEFFPNLKYDH